SRFDQRLLERAADAGLDGERVGVDPLRDRRLDALQTRDLVEQPFLVRRQHEPVVGAANEPQLAVTADDVLDVEADVLRNGVLRELVERGDDLRGAETGSGGVPERQRRKAIGVDVLGTLLELREAGDGIAALFVTRMRGLEQDRPITLNDQRPVRTFYQST